MLQYIHLEQIFAQTSLSSQVRRGEKLLSQITVTFGLGRVVQQLGSITPHTSFVAPSMNQMLHNDHLRSKNSKLNTNFILKTGTYSNIGQIFSYLLLSYLAFYQVTHDLVVEIIDRSPADTLLDILLLLRFQCQLNENLLQLLVDKVDAKLLKSIFLSQKKYIFQKKM